MSIKILNYRSMKIGRITFKQQKFFTGLFLLAIIFTPFLTLAHQSHAKQDQSAAEEKLKDGQAVIYYNQACGMCAEYVRSEERRVGKECRSRWSPYH